MSSSDISVASVACGAGVGSGVLATGAIVTASGAVVGSEVGSTIGAAVAATSVGGATVAFVLTAGALPQPASTPTRANRVTQRRRWFIFVLSLLRSRVLSLPLCNLRRMGRWQFQK